MIPLSKSNFELHFYGKPFAKYFMEYGKSEENFGDKEYEKLLKGKSTYAIHPLDKNNKSTYFVYDVDGPEDGGESTLSVAKNLESFLLKKKLYSTTFFSGNKGFHLYVFFDTPVVLHYLRELAINLLKDFVGYDKDTVEIEVFPKQANLDYDQRKWGNHLKSPFSIHPKTGKKSEQITDYKVNVWAPTFETVENKQYTLFDKVDIEILSKCLAPSFIDGERHKITLGVSGYLKSNGVSKDKTISIFKRVIELSGGEESDIFRVIEDTYNAPDKKLADLGYAGLSPEIESKIFLFISSVDPEDIKTDVLQIRSTKSLPHIKVDKITTILIDHIKSKYKLFHDDNFIYLIFGDRIFTNHDRSFESLLISFGVNTEESLGKQVRKVILDFLYINTEYSSPINYSEYGDNTISVYTKESIVKVTTNNVTEVNEFIPVTNRKDFTYIKKSARKESLFNFIEEFSLKKEDNDLLLSWLISQMFNEDTNTKPVLLIQGPPGSGKSTLANFLMRLIESKESVITAYTGKDDAMIASLQKHKVLVLDNLEFITGKTIDLINAVVTGAAIELRALYTTNEVALIKPKSSLVITSAHGSFDNDGAFQSRLIKIILDIRNTFGVESEFWGKFNEYYNDLVSDLLDICSVIIDARKRGGNRNYALRMTDFIKICDILKLKSYIETDLERYITEQQEREKYKTPLLKVFMRIRFKEELYHPFTIQEIFQRFRAVANSFGIEKINVNNLPGKLLKTGIFINTSDGRFKLLKPIHYSLENNLD